jgi:hypothetical protein
MYVNSTGNIVLNGEKLKVFPVNFYSFVCEYPVFPTTRHGTR